MFEVGEYVEVIDEIYMFPLEGGKLLAFRSGDVVPIKEKINNESYIVYSLCAKCNVLILKNEIKKLNKNDVTIVMRE
jgi:hypothetical protein